MARGFESKDVEFQQAEASRSAPARKVLTSEEREREDQRRTLQLSLSKLRADRATATNPRHQAMLDQAIRSLEEQL